MTTFATYLLSIIPALAVFVVLHKRDIFPLPSPFSALMCALFWPAVIAFLVAVESCDLLGPKWDSLNEWWDAP